MSANIVPLPTAGQRYSRDQLELVKRTLMPKGSTDDELSLFLGIADRLGLDPFAQQIRAIRREQWNAATRQMEPRISIEPGIDGFRKVGHETGEVRAQLGPFWCGPDGVWTDKWLSEDPPAAAKFGLLRAGYTEPRWVVAHWREYRQTKRDGSVTKMWADRPAGQLAKCAEALAWRAVFPHQLGGVYTTEEMAQADPGNEAATISRFAVVEGGIPTEETIRDLESTEAAKELVTREIISDRFRQAVKAAEVDLFGEVWEDFWRHAGMTEWRQVLLAAREQIGPKAIETAGAGGAAGPPAAEPASAPTSEGEARPATPARAPSDLTSGGEVSSAAAPPGPGASAADTSDTGNDVTGRSSAVEAQTGEAAERPAGDETGVAQRAVGGAPAASTDLGPVVAWCQAHRVQVGTARVYLSRQHADDYGPRSPHPLRNTNDLAALEGEAAGRAVAYLAAQFTQAGEPKDWEDRR